MEALIIKYITKEISAKELKKLEEWLKDPKNKALFEEYIQVSDLLDISLSGLDLKKEYNNLEKRIANADKPVRKLHVAFLKYAAVLVVALGISFGLYQLNFFKNKNAHQQEPLHITLQLEDGTIKVIDEETPVLVTNNNKYSTIDTLENKENQTAIAYNTITIPFGKKFQLELSDGTHVFLNSGTELKYPKSFVEGKNREVFLDGEAYFSVVKNEKAPFIVKTSTMDVQVLGTKFNVSSYQNEDKTSAILVEGSVTVRNNKTDDNTIIKPGQAAIIQAENMAVNEVDIEKYIAWTKGKLVFIDERFEDVLKKLERFYNVKIINEYPYLSDVHYNGTFDAETIAQVLNAFQGNTSFNYKTENNVITIKKP